MMVRLVHFRRGFLLIVGAAGAAFVLWILTRSGAALWKDPASQFPMPVPGTDLVILQMLPYTGEYLESAPTDMVSELAAICLKNTGTEPIRFASVKLSTQAGAYTFQVEMLPPSMGVIVLENDRQPYSDATITACNGFQETDNSHWLTTSLILAPQDNHNLAITNPTGTTIRDVTIYYKYYLPENDLLLGGIVYTYRAGDIRPGETIFVWPYRFLQDWSRILHVETGNEY